MMPVFKWIVTACWTAFILYWVASSVGVKRDIEGRSWWRSWWVRMIVIAVLLGMLSRLLLLRPLGHYFGLIQSAEGSVVLAAIGSALSALGVALAIWARAHLGRNWSAAPALKEGHELVTTGPYRLIRHPIYTGIIMAILGSTLVTPRTFVMLVVVCAMLIWRIGVEEDLMMRQFPDQYPEYTKQTWALIPYLW